MIPLQIAGIAVAGSALLAKYSNTQRKDGQTGPFNLNLPQFPKLELPKFDWPRPELPKLELPPIELPKQMQSMFDGIASTLTQLTKGITGEDYTRIVKGFIPEGAALLQPRHLQNDGELGMADIDGDLKEELLASYKVRSGVGTIVLKKMDEQWYKAAELFHPEFEDIRFRDVLNITGSNRQQLVLGFPSGKNRTVLHAYSLENGALKKLFEKDCRHFDFVASKPGDDRQISPLQFAFWDRNPSNMVTVDVMRWNGLQLEPAADASSYFRKKVVPWHTRSIRANPYSPLSWYSFAHALESAGYRTDALTAADTGLALDKGSEYRDQFLELRKRLEESTN